MFVILIAACSQESTRTEVGDSLLASPTPSYADWDIGGGLILQAPPTWGIVVHPPNPRCPTPYSSGFQDYPEGNTMDLSIPFTDSPFGDFDMKSEYNGVQENGDAWRLTTSAAVYQPEENYYATREAGSVSVSALAENTGARVSLTDVQFRSPSGVELRVTASLDLDIHVGCAVPVGDPGETGDGDADNSCVNVSQPAPYTDETCLRLTADFPVDVRY